ncbi:hypothetical protein [Lichenifustis flavocetrariae]|uniref:Uncharacterized protein n=1 Tax=Lichenifustis flavocetrariae TaxID=2949735 RepID=A0AA41YZA7_9HYPH|nr:hypothetical protein [Lichenifustis flavocetrariae]MCW6511324.1 hypothetical protein [Lichenifustis flavocetrariae]
MRLIALPTGELILAVQTGGLTDLTEDDKAKVLQHLARQGVAAPKFAAASSGTRKPRSIKGKGLPCGPRQRGPGRRILALKTLSIIAVIGWLTIIIVDYLWILSPGEHG